MLVKEWEDYFNRYSEYYGFLQVPGQMTKARGEFDKAKDKAGLWLIQGGKDVDKSFSRADFKIPMSTRARVEEFQKKLAHIHELQDQEIPVFNKDVEKARLQVAKAEAAQLRNELLADLKQPIDEALTSLLTPEQKAMKAMSADFGKSWAELSRLEWIDLAVSWGLVVVGACLMLGFFTRTSAFAGAVFLMMLYAAMPPLPWVPEVTRTEGKYLFVNKKLRRCWPLLVHRHEPNRPVWVGLDGLISYFNPFRRRQGRWRRRECRRQSPFFATSDRTCQRYLYQIWRTFSLAGKRFKRELDDATRLDRRTKRTRPHQLSYGGWQPRGSPRFHERHARGRGRAANFSSGLLRLPAAGR